MSRTFLMTHMVIAGAVTAYGHTRYTIADRMDSAAVDDFVHQVAQRAGVTDDKVVILNVFELEGPE